MCILADSAELWETECCSDYASSSILMHPPPKLSTNNKEFTNKPLVSGKIGPPPPKLQDHSETSGLLVNSL